MFLSAERATAKLESSPVEGVKVTFGSEKCQMVVKATDNYICDIID